MILKKYKGNKIESKGAAKIGEALKTNSTITYMSIMGVLKDNCEQFVGNTDCTEFLEALGYNSSLTKLQLWSE